MRYGEQIFEVEVPLDGVDWSGPDPIAAITDAFHARHEALYTYALRDQEAVLVNARLAVIGRLPAMPAEPALARGGAGPARRRPPGLARRLARAARPPARRPGPGTADRWPRHHRIGHDHGAGAPRRFRVHDPARLAGHRHLRRMMHRRSAGGPSHRWRRLREAPLYRVAASVKHPGRVQRSQNGQIRVRSREWVRHAG